METYDLAEAAERSGLSTEELGRLVELGIVTPASGNQFMPGHLRRVGLVIGLTGAGVPLEGLGAAIRSGQVSLDFLDAPAFDRFAGRRLRRGGGRVPRGRPDRAQGRGRCHLSPRRRSPRMS